MSRMALTFPVLPGKDSRAIVNEMKSRPREYEQSRRRLGITMERAYLQHTPMGDYATVYFEAEGDLLEQFGKLASSDLDIDRYFMKAVKEIHGVDLAQPMPGPKPETVAAWVDPTAKGRGRGLALCAPLTPGATERARAFADDAYHRDEFTASRRRLNVNEELLTLQSTPQGDIVGIYIEGDDPWEGNAGFARSRDPFDLWFKEELTRIFPPEVDFSKPIEGVEEIFDSTKVADLSLGKAA
jgi:hypothetical protein